MMLSCILNWIAYVPNTQGIISPKVRVIGNDLVFKVETITAEIEVSS